MHSFKKLRIVVALVVGPLIALSADAAGLDFSTLPLPRGAKKIYVDSYSAIYSVEAPVAATTEASEKLLLAEGWIPYGSAGLTRYYKRGGTRLLATVQSEAGRAARTMISFSSEPMSADLPLLPHAEEVQYNDSDKRLGFLAALAPEGVADYYRKALAPSGWSTTMDKPDKSDFVYTIIFHSPKQEMIRIEMTPTEGKVRTTVTYSTAEEVAAEKQRVAAGMAALREKLAKEASAPKPKVKVSLPVGTTSKAMIKQVLKLNLPAGKANSAVESLRKELLAAGWKEVNASLDPVGGTVSLTHDGHSLSIVYIDPGFMPAEITVTPLGVEIELAQVGAK